MERQHKATTKSGPKKQLVSWMWLASEAWPSRTTQLWFKSTKNTRIQAFRSWLSHATSSEDRSLAPQLISSLSLPNMVWSSRWWRRLRSMDQGHILLTNTSRLLMEVQTLHGISQSSSSTEMEKSSRTMDLNAILMRLFLILKHNLPNERNFTKVLIEQS